MYYVLRVEIMLVTLNLKHIIFTENAVFHITLLDYDNSVHSPHIWKWVFLCTLFQKNI